MLTNSEGLKKKNEGIELLLAVIPESVQYSRTEIAFPLYFENDKRVWIKIDVTCGLPIDTLKNGKWEKENENSFNPFEKRQEWLNRENWVKMRKGE